jgi:hypothetical protein
VAKLLIAEGAKAELNGEWSDVGEVAADVVTGGKFGSPLHVASLVGNTKFIALLLEDLGDRDRNSQCEFGRHCGEWTH